MNDRTNKLTETVNVTMHQCAFLEKDISYAKVQRNTAYIGNIINTILERNQTLDRETLLFSAGLLKSGILQLLKAGKAVDLLEMGTLYIKPEAGMETANPSINDVPSMVLNFTPSALALDAVKDVVVAADVTETNEPILTDVFDLHTRSYDNNLSRGYTVRIRGKRLKIAGKEEESGVFLAACDEHGKYVDDASTWNHILPADLIDNTAGMLEFNLPSDIETGNYRLIVQTAYGSGTRVNKTIRKGLLQSIVRVV